MSRKKPKKLVKKSANQPQILTEAEYYKCLAFYGPNVKDIETANLAWWPYGGFLVDHASDIIYNKHVLPCPPFIDESTFYGQGADIFAAPAYSMYFGQYICAKAFNAIDSFSPQKGDLFLENWRSIRSGITLGLLGAYELVQSNMPNRSFDTADILAYAVGLTAFFHKKDILRATVETVEVIGNTATKVSKQLFGCENQKLY